MKHAAAALAAIVCVTAAAAAPVAPPIEPVEVNPLNLCDFTVCNLDIIPGPNRPPNPGRPPTSPRPPQRSRGLSTAITERGKPKYEPPPRPTTRKKGSKRADDDYAIVSSTTGPDEAVPEAEQQDQGQPPQSKRAPIFPVKPEVPVLNLGDLPEYTSRVAKRAAGADDLDGAI
jgi:hypothetical protein